MPDLITLPKDEKVCINKDANAYLTNRLQKADWVLRWGHLNPLAYSTIPVYMMDRRKFSISED